MSYDLRIGDTDFNITYNLAPMFYAAHAGGIRATYGMPGREALSVWRAMRDYFEEHEAELRDLEPDNGWGTYDGALEFLSLAIRASIKQPDDMWVGD